MIDHPTGAGATDGPISPDAFKKAVYRSAPRSFTVKLLPPEKQGSSYYYRVRVSPIKDDDASFITCITSSGASVASHGEYDIYRKWEDCLWFQETLEVEYFRLARAKRNRLASGRGVKKNGVYIHSDRAASFESLPFGPDPDNIARDIHEHIPKLTKKGTLFRPSQETIDQRFEELRVMLRSLFLDDLPTLIKDIKDTHTFTDFFGVWRRDDDLAKEARASKESRPRASTTSIFSSYFSSSTHGHSSVSLSPSKGKQPATASLPIRSPTYSDSSSEDLAGTQRTRRSVESRKHSREELSPVRPRVPSSGSLGSPSLPSTPVSPNRQLPSNARQPIIVSHDVPIRFGHNPHAVASERPTSLLESLPEDRELSSSPQSDLDAEVWSQRRTASSARKANRTATIYHPSPPDLSEFSESPARSSSRASRLSTATLRANAYLDDLDVDFSLPSADPEHGPNLHPRASVSSMASIMTGYSVDAVLPHHQRPTLSSRHSMRRPLSLPEEQWEDDDPWNENDSNYEGEEFDAYFFDSIRPDAPTPDAYPQTPTVDDPIFQISQRMSTATIITSFASSTYSDRRSSLTTSISSGSTGNSSIVDPVTLSIKAMHEDSIVMLRLPRHTTFEELRKKIYDKFIQTGKSTISQSFAIALLVPEKADRGAGRPRAASLSSLGSIDSNKGGLHFISSSNEWDEIASTYEGKMLLRIIGSRG